MADNDEVLAQFQDVTGADVERSRFFLESSGWNLEIALGSFFENVDVPAEDDQPSSATSAAGAGPPPLAPPPTASSRPSANTSNIRTFESDSEDSDSDMEEGQAFYAGGSETSGQQILGPPKKKDGRDLVKEMFKRAREHGAEAVESSQGPTAGPSRPVFVGSGFRLGSTEVPSQEIGQPSAQASPSKPREFTLKMWRNGFSIDDGNLRPYDDPANRDFLRSVMSGRIPTELIAEAKGGEVHVNMEDHKDEEFKPPKVTVKPFQGTGFVLGSVVPPVVDSSAAAAAATVAPDQVKVNEETAQRELGVDSNSPTTTIQIRMPDGRLQAKLNHSHTVGDLRRYIQLARPHLALSNFSLMMTFPNKELIDETETLQQAGLINAAILLRMK